MVYLEPFLFYLLKCFQFFYKNILSSSLNFLGVSKVDWTVVIAAVVFSGRRVYSVFFVVLQLRLCSIG